MDKAREVRERHTIMRRFLLLLAVLICAVRTDAAPSDKDYHETLNGAILHFRVRGEDAANPYLIILHGGPGFSSHMFYPWGRSIEAKFNVVYMDQRGCGESEHLKFKIPYQPEPDEIKGYTLPVLLKDIEAVREFLKVKQWVVLGHSWGGMLGLEYIAAYPASVASYIHVDGLVSQPMLQDSILTATERIIARDETSSKPAILARAKDLKSFLPQARKLPVGPDRLFSCMQFAFALFSDLYYADAAVGQAYNQKVSDAVKAYEISPNVMAPASEPAVALLRTASYATRDCSPLLAKIKCRTLIVNGKQDGIITPAHAEKAHTGIKASRLLLLDRCGHFPFAEQPAEFTKAVLDFALGRP